MQWSPEQQRALDAVATWFQDGGDQVYRLFGYAGTGKTTLARHFAEGVSGPVLFGAFTGKAAHVLRQKGCVDATTIHSLIYLPKDKSKRRLRELEDQILEVRSEMIREGRDERSIESSDAVTRLRVQIAEEQENLKRPMFTLDLNSRVRDASLVIIDECSMVDRRMGQDLRSFGVPILVLGDPAQLPPVAADEGYFTSDPPDFMLSEIHRQAKDSPIIRLATEVREGRDLVLGDYGDSRVIDWADVELEDAKSADQILVGTNKLRRGTNSRMRELLGMTGSMPKEGDRLVCLRNDHEVGLLNGGLWKVNSSFVEDADKISLDIQSDDGQLNIVCAAHTAHFLGEKPAWWDRKEAQEFDYGYALTCHKSQGSQWPRVMVFDQSRSFRQHQKKWLYTAITRASDSVIVVQP